MGDSKKAEKRNILLKRNLFFFTKNFEGMERKRCVVIPLFILAVIGVIGAGFGFASFLTILKSDERTELACYSNSFPSYYFYVLTICFMVLIVVFLIVAIFLVPCTDVCRRNFKELDIKSGLRIFPEQMYTSYSNLF